MTIAILVLVILTFLAMLGSPARDARMIQDLTALRAEVQAARTEIANLTQQLERRFF